VALFYAEENWRGARAWNRYREAMAAKGEQLDLAAFVPQPIPEEQNFAATPLVKSWFEKRSAAAENSRWDDSFGKVEKLIYATQPGEQELYQSGQRQFMDLAGWAAAFTAVRAGETIIEEKLNSGRLDIASRAKAAPAVLEALKDDEAIFAELRAASSRPRAQYPVVFKLDDPWGIMLPHLLNVRYVCVRLQLKACAELAAGRSEQALADVELLLRMADSLKDEPFIVSYLLRMACVKFAVQPVWEGLAENAWTDAQLQTLQARFQAYNFVADMKRPFDCERAAGALTVDLIRRKGLALLVELVGPGDTSSEDRKLANWIGGFIPRGWYYLEQVNHCRLYELQLDGVCDPVKKSIAPDRSKANLVALEQALARSRLGKTVGDILHHRLIATLFLPALGKIPMKAATAQTAVDQAALACALERYRRANGNYPETLATLAPTFGSQPSNDVVTDKPPVYRRASNGQFQLYSIGWDGKDDGGKPGKLPFDENEGDWLWSYPSGPQ
jgi:hypothetical protein